MQNKRPETLQNAQIAAIEAHTVRIHRKYAVLNIEKMQKVQSEYKKTLAIRVKMSILYMQNKAVRPKGTAFLISWQTGEAMRMKIMKGVNTQRLIITIGILMVIGAILPWFVYQANPKGLDVVVVLCDILFAQAFLILLWGFIRLIGNAKMFTSTSYGFKRLHDLYRNKIMKAEVMKEDYLTYRENRPHHYDARPILLIGAFWMVIAAIASMLA